MASSNSHILPLALAVLLAAAACSRPAGDHRFISSETARRQGGTYLFEETFDDGARYALTLAARVVTSRIPGGNLELDIRIKAPDGTTAIERVALPLQPADGVAMTLGSGSVADFAWPWRELPGDEGAGPGTWTFTVQPADPAIADAIYGIGLSFEPSDGKR